MTVVAAEVRPYIVAGHSHANAMGMPAAAWGTPPTLTPLLWGTASGLTCGGPRTLDYWQTLCEFAPGKTILLFWQGNQHYQYLLIDREGFDFHLPDDAAGTEHPLVPLALVRHALDAANAELRRVVLPMLAAAPGCSVVIVGSPPPIGDDGAIRSRLLTEMHFLNVITKSGLSVENVALTPRGVRLKLWKVVQTLLAETADAASVRFLPVPRGAGDAEGFLRHEYWSGDVSHANISYGAELWRHIHAELPAGDPAAGSDQPRPTPHSPASLPSREASEAVGHAERRRAPLHAAPAQ